MRGNVDRADFVHVQRFGRLVGEGVDVYTMAQRGDRRGDLIGFGAQIIGAAGHQRGFVEPDDMSGELVGNVRASVGGSQVRVALTNRFGTKPLRIGAAHVATRAAGPAIVEKSGGALMFRGKPSITIEPSAVVLSDPVALEEDHRTPRPRQFWASPSLGAVGRR